MRITQTQERVYALSLLSPFPAAAFSRDCYTLPGRDSPLRYPGQDLYIKPTSRRSAACLCACLCAADPVLLECVHFPSLCLLLSLSLSLRVPSPGGDSPAQNTQRTASGRRRPDNRWDIHPAAAAAACVLCNLVGSSRWISCSNGCTFFGMAFSSFNIREFFSFPPRRVRSFYGWGKKNCYAFSAFLIMSVVIKPLNWNGNSVI